MNDIDNYILALAGDSGDEASAERGGNNGPGGGGKKSGASERPQASRRTSSAAGKGGKQSGGKGGRSKRRGDSDDDDDGIFDSDDDEEEGEADDGSSVDMDEDDDDLYKDEYGPDLYRDDEDRRRLAALPEVEREQILNERSEKRQEMLERKQIKQQVKLKMLKEGKGDDSARRSKMSKESRGEDLTRRSSRAKDSARVTASRGLSELKRRREEKSTRPTSSGRGHGGGSESPERRKRRRGSGSGGSEDEYGSESEESESEDEGKKSKRVPTLDEINSIRLTRTLLEKWMHLPFFKKTVIGCFTRIMLGLDPATKARVYRVTEITDVVDYHRTYRIEAQLTNKCLVLKHGKASRNFTMDVVSNQPFTQSEYTRYFATLENEGVRGPTLDHVEAKREDLKGANAYVLTDAEVDDMIRRKRALASVPANVAAEKAGLLAKIEQAKDEGDNETLKGLEARLRQIEEVTAGGSGHEQLDAWARLNKKNRERDQKDLRVAEKRQVEERKKLMGANAQDPFARRKTQPKLVHAPIPSSSVTPDAGNSPAGTPPLPGSALAALNISGKTIFTLLEAPRVSEAAAAIGRAARPMSKYEEMVSRQDLDVDFDDDD